MTLEDVGDACFICEKHRAGDAAEGGVLYQDDLVYVGHIHALAGPTAYRGHAVPHVHVQLMPRYPGTPRDHWGPRLSSWPDAPRVDAVSMRQLVTELRLHLNAAAS